MSDCIFPNGRKGRILGPVSAQLPEGGIWVSHRKWLVLMNGETDPDILDLSDFKDAIFSSRVVESAAKAFAESLPLVADAWNRLAKCPA